MILRVLLLGFITAVNMYAAPEKGKKEDAPKKKAVDVSAGKQVSKKTPISKDVKKQPAKETKVQKPDMPPKMLKQLGKWKMVTLTENQQKVFYIMTNPHKEDQSVTRKDQAYFMITNRPQAKMLNTVSVTGGYALNEKSKVQLIFGEHNFSLFPKDNLAWAKDEDEAKILEMMKKNNFMMVRITNGNSKTEDVYSLSEFTSALNELTKVSK